MIRFAALTAAVLMTASAAAPAGAQQARATATPQRVVMLCDYDALTRAAYRREFGERRIHVTAEQVLQARAANETWTTPRCISARENLRLRQMTTAYAAVR